MYIQDDWEPTGGLTFNLGLRYDRQLGAYGDYFANDQTLTGQLVGAQAVAVPR